MITPRNLASLRHFSLCFGAQTRCASGDDTSLRDMDLEAGSCVRVTSTEKLPLVALGTGPETSQRSDFLESSASLGSLLGQLGKRSVCHSLFGNPPTESFQFVKLGAPSKICQTKQVFRTTLLNCFLVSLCLFGLLGDDSGCWMSARTGSCFCIPGTSQ